MPRNDGNESGDNGNRDARHDGNRQHADEREIERETEGSRGRAHDGAYEYRDDAGVRDPLRADDRTEAHGGH